MWQKARPRRQSVKSFVCWHVVLIYSQVKLLKINPQIWIFYEYSRYIFLYVKFMRYASESMNNGSTKSTDNIFAYQFSHKHIAFMKSYTQCRKDPGEYSLNRNVYNLSRSQDFLWGEEESLKAQKISHESVSRKTLFILQLTINLLALAYYLIANNYVKLFRININQINWRNVIPCLGNPPRQVPCLWPVVIVRKLDFTNLYIVSHILHVGGN